MVQQSKEYFDQKYVKKSIPYMFVVGDVVLMNIKNCLKDLNFPSRPAYGVRVTAVGHHRWEDSVVTRQDPEGRDYHWVAGVSRAEASARSTSSSMLPRRSQAMALSQATESTGVHFSGT